MELNKYNTALDLRKLSLKEVRKLYELGKHVVNRVGHVGMIDLSGRDEWSILIFHEGEYKRVYPEFSALKDFTFIDFEKFVFEHFYS